MKSYLILIFATLSFLNKSFSEEIDNIGIACEIVYQENLYIWFNKRKIELFYVTKGDININIKPAVKKVNTNISFISDISYIFWSDNRAYFELDRKSLVLSKTYKNKNLGMLPHYYKCEVASNKKDFYNLMKPHVELVVTKYNLLKFYKHQKKIRKVREENEKRKSNKI